MAKYKKPVIYTLLAILIIFHLIRAVKEGGDLESYLRAATRIIEDAPLYIQETVPYIYPPLIAFLLIPLSFPPPAVTKIFWYILNLFLIGFSLKLLLRLIDYKDINIFNLVSLSVLFTLRFFMNNSNLGQINVVILFLCVTTLYFFIHNKDIYAGIILALAIVIKITPVLLLFYFIYKREFRLVISSIAGAVVFLFIPSFAFGLENYINILSQYREIISNFYDSTYFNQSFYNTFVHFLSPVSLWNNMQINIASLDEYQIKFIIYTIFGFISLLFAFIFREKIKNRNDLNVLFEYSMVIILMLLFSPVSRKAHFVTLLIPHLFYLYIIIKFKVFPRKKLISILFAVSFVFNTLTVEGVIGRNPSDFMESLSCITFGTIVLLTGLVMLRRINLNRYQL